jgi:pyruvate-ferredoxin/flavodoxin oxidoreductase
LKFFVVDAFAIARETGMGSFINMIMQTSFFKLANVLPFEEAIELLKKSVRKMFAKKGDEVVAKNIGAIDHSLTGLKEIIVPPEWANAVADPVPVLPGIKSVKTLVRLCCVKKQFYV